MSEMDGFTLSGLNPNKVLTEATMDKPVAPTRPAASDLRNVITKLGLDMSSTHDQQLLDAYIDGSITLPSITDSNDANHNTALYQEVQKLIKYKDDYSQYKADMKEWKAGSDQRKQNFKEFEKLTGEDLISRSQLAKAKPNKEDYWKEDGTYDFAGYESAKRSYEELERKFNNQFEKYGLDASYNVVNTDAKYYQQLSKDYGSGTLLISADKVSTLLDDINNQLVQRVLNQLENGIKTVKARSLEWWNSPGAGQELANTIQKKYEDCVSMLETLRTTNTRSIQDLADKIVEADRKIAQGMQN